MRLSDLQHKNVRMKGACAPTGDLWHCHCDQQEAGYRNRTWVLTRTPKHIWLGYFQYPSHMVPGVGFEPTHLSASVFETDVSAVPPPGQKLKRAS